MSDTGNVSKSLRERLGGTTEDRLGRALSELFENPLLTGAIGRAFDAREKAAQAQEVAMGALNLPSAADIERLTRRLRAVSHRLEGIEDGVDRLDRALAPSGVEARLSGIESQLEHLTEKIDRALKGDGAASGRAPARRGASGGASSSRAGATVARSDKQVRAAREAKSRKAPKGKAARSPKSAKALRSASGAGAGSRASRKS